MSESPDNAGQAAYSQEELRASYDGIYNRHVKRAIDFVIALVLVVPLLPLFFVLGLLIVLETGFPVFYRPWRGGYKDRKFRIFKFRTMVRDADRIGGGTTALNDSRITKVGAFLRKTKLDEIPQLINVLNGTMSFIGPRPELLKYTDHYDAMDKNILNVRPGITDFSSICFINLDEIVGAENAEEMFEKHVLRKKNALRLKYVAEVSFDTDCRLFLRTVYEVICKALRFIFKRN